MPLGADALLYDYLDDDFERMQHTFLLSRAETIYGGSSQIQRNTIGERVLGLPTRAAPGACPLADLRFWTRRRRAVDLLLADRVADLHVHHPELDARGPR